MNKSDTNKNYKTIIPVICGVIILGFLVSPVTAADLNFEAAQKNIELNDNGVVYEIISTVKSVEEFLKEHQRGWRFENDLYFSKYG
ncbi:MAG: hypothetical protein US82_C0043G0011 [Parcubacteria group bacterium GW2011_GWC1_38_22]|nr:MAG: hypothetical protein US82_C0043G0011 [Parcubacteria group bacterium GW2011_GWC1_38_22]